VGALVARRRKPPVTAAAAPKAPTVKAAAVPPVVSPAAYTDSSADPMTATHSNLEEVDPLAEAEVYLNYGRENQAEEILREAIAKSPSRQELYLKLLGIYVKRGDATAFESVARKLYTVAGGTGASWQAAADMGASIDPANALYAGSSPVAKARPSAPAPVASSVAPAAIAAAAAAATLAPTPAAAALRPLDIEKTQVLSVDDLRPQGGPPTIDFDFEPAGPAATASPAISDLTLEIGGPAEAQSDATVTDMDFTLDFGAPGTLSVPELPDLPLEPPSEGTQTAEADLNFDPVFPVAGGEQGLPTPLFNSEATNVLLDSGPATGSIRDFKREAERAESGLSSADSMSGEPTQSSLGQDTMIMANPGELVTFDMTHPAGLPQNWQEATLPRVDLDLGDTQMDGRNPDKDEHWNDVNTKCDLAKAYEEMGDKDGAREILREVLAEGDAQQKADAEAMLARLG
jgi:pilus assembly protein FimV